MLFQGEEWGASTPFQYFTDHADVDLGRAVSDGRRREFVHFGWDPELVPDPQVVETFQRSKLDWAEIATPSHAGLLAWYRELIALRRRTPALADPRLDLVDVAVDDERRCLTLARGRRGSWSTSPPRSGRSMSDVAGGCSRHPIPASVPTRRWSECPPTP